MKKLFMITDVDELDVRHYMKDDMIGTVVSAEVTDDCDAPLTTETLYVHPDGSARGTTFQDVGFWYGYNYDYKPAFHSAIKVKPLQV